MSIAEQLTEARTREQQILRDLDRAQTTLANKQRELREERELIALLEKNVPPAPVADAQPKAK
jgi:Spy/CpxP family protein refolding chaperone